jgi:hypothetical protein
MSRGKNYPPRIYPIDSTPCGKPWHEWVELWWKWCYSGSIENSPASDSHGKICAEGQIHEKIWFLAGTFGGKAERKCNVPLGSSIFFPLINDLISFATDPQLKTEDELRAYAEADLDRTRFLSASVDGYGYELQQLKVYRIQTPIFELGLPTESHDGNRISTKAVSDGYWVFLEPLSVGEHRIEFSGEKLEFDKMQASYKQNVEEFSFRVEVTYHVTVR